jgi:hypothetical protein
MRHTQPVRLFLYSGLVIVPQRNNFTAGIELIAADMTFRSDTATADYANPNARHGKSPYDTI